MKNNLLLAALCMLLLSFPAAAVDHPQRTADLPAALPVIVMTHPTLFQVRNIVELYERDILPLPAFVLLGIYHEDEFADPGEAKAYREAFDFVRENEITWVRFRRITGRVERRDLFRENAWTQQFREIFAGADGMIFTGGMDIPPAVYGQETRLLTEPATPWRSLCEISLLFHLLGGERNPSFVPFLAEKRDFPVLAICLGMQSMNVALGGTLIQDIPSAIYGCKTVEEVLAGDADRIHSGVYLEKLHPHDPDLASPFHRIRLAADSLFVRKMGMTAGATPSVATSHHQAIDQLGAGLRVAATSMDNRIVEAVEHARFTNVLGVQFHPERHTLYRKGLFQHLQPGLPLDFNPRSFLKTHPPSYEFHLAIWNWFGGRVGL